MRINHTTTRSASLTRLTSIHPWGNTLAARTVVTVTGATLMLPRLIPARTASMKRTISILNTRVVVRRGGATGTVALGCITVVLAFMTRGDRVRAQAARCLGLYVASRSRKYGSVSQ